MVDSYYLLVLPQHVIHKKCGAIFNKELNKKPRKKLNEKMAG